MSNKAVIVPAGTYMLGDPCYFVPRKDWMELLKSSDYFNSPVGVTNGNQVFAFNTAHGDGIYSDNLGNCYPVDAGLIGLTPFDYTTDTSERLGNLVTFAEYTICSCEDGVLTFGDIVINTDRGSGTEEDDEYQ